MNEGNFGSHLQEIWQAVKECKQKPETRHIPIYLLAAHQGLDHTQIEAIEAVVHSSGVDAFLDNESFQQVSPKILADYIHPSPSYPDGWDEPLPPLAQQGVKKFNQQQYFDQHESFELAWRAESRPIRDLYQGILQIGLAFLQIERGNWAGAVKMLRRGLPKLRRLPPVCQGIQLVSFIATAEEIHATLVTLGPENLSQLDKRHFQNLQILSASA